MTKLLELREQLKTFMVQNERYVVLVIKFILAMSCFWAIRSTLGAGRIIDQIVVILILSVICAMMDTNVTVIMSGIVIVIQLMYIAPELALVMFLLFLFMFAVYFSLTPSDGSILLLTAILCAVHLPFLVPVCAGLLRKPNTTVPISFGVIIYYGLKVMGSASLKTGADQISDSVTVIALKQLASNKEFLLLLGVSAFAVLLVYAIRRLSVDYAWQLAIGFGMLGQLLALLIGNFVLSLHMSLVWLFVGCFISCIVAIVLQFFVFQLDYKRTEYVQFEDDEYYYYVKAVPKISVSTKDVKVKNINTAKKTINKEMLDEELDVDQDLLD